ncbi:hypothetical protein PVK06_045282 [Gossypium arboreum]|uniref:Uncharacterized protein n=1 Tax=Gossypium arboreum TaxID=29729 RepID=A0ABR0MTZ6_GOSAR|nr:hypothetical protein PVK06_045282 [Gossypium arboreum]
MIADGHNTTPNGVPTTLQFSASLKRRQSRGLRLRERGAAATLQWRAWLGQDTPGNGGWGPNPFSTLSPSYHSFGKGKAMAYGWMANGLVMTFPLGIT